jgi:hypothetical protein
MMTLRKMLPVAIAAAVVGCFAVPGNLSAATGEIVTFTASGTFSTPATSGSDTLKLAGEPFSVTISASTATPPYKHGPNWAAFHQLKLTGTVHSGLLGTSPISIASGEASIIQAFAPTQYDLFTMEAPVQVVGIALTIKAVIVLPYGTFVQNPLLQPFSAIALAPGNATMTYSDSSADTVLGIATGSLSGTVPTSPAVSQVFLHSNGMTAVTTHVDGSSTETSLRSGPLMLGPSSDTVNLKLYATGLSGASSVHAQIAGEEVPVVYAGASQFAGLDELIVRVPQSMAGRGITDVTFTADGKTAEPVAVTVQ